MRHIHTFSNSVIFFLCSSSLFPLIASSFSLSSLSTISSMLLHSLTRGDTSFLTVAWNQYLWWNNNLKHMYSYISFFYYKFLEDISPFRGATDTPVLDFWRRLPWVSKPGRIPRLRALSPACNEFLSFTSGVTPADFLRSAKPFWSTTCRRVHKHWWRFGAQTHDRLCSKHGAVDLSVTPARLILIFLAEIWQCHYDLKAEF